MKLTVFWLQFAENKLLDIHSYYSNKAGKRVAQKIVSGIIETTEKLSTQPEIGAVEELLARRKFVYRYLIYSNYKIVYHINKPLNRVEIANVFDTRRNPVKMNEIK
jgi:plasmid stabilization system protein ParE